MKLTLSTLNQANKNAVNKVSNASLNNIISRVLIYVIKNHQNLRVTREQLCEYIKLSNFQNYFLLDGNEFTQKFANLEELFIFIEKNQDKLSSRTNAGQTKTLDVNIQDWLKRADAYVSTHFLNSKATKQMSLNFDAKKRFKHTCKELETGEIQFTPIAVETATDKPIKKAS